MADWQPIETAPRDGRAILVYQTGRGFYTVEGQMGVACFEDDGFGNSNMWVARDCCDSVTTYEATHWMPLPDPPDAEQPARGP